MITVGDFVESNLFDGVGKVAEVTEKKVVIGFFRSPVRVSADQVEIPLDAVHKYQLLEETNCYVLTPTGRFRRARYGGPRPGNQHLAIFKRDEYQVVDSNDLFIPQTGSEGWFDVQEFIAEQVCDGSNTLRGCRENFVTSYLKQKKIAGGSPCFFASGVEIEPHQIAVVKRIILDPVKKYLLADEVGLGKTIESGLLLIEHLFRSKGKTRCLISVPFQLRRQWVNELLNRFFLGTELGVFPEEYSASQLVYVVGHNDVTHAEEELGPFNFVVIDEAHQIVPTHLEGKDLIYTTHRNIVSHSDEAYLLSGTPLGGNDISFLGMLSLLDSSAFDFNSEGLQKFRDRRDVQEKIGGIYASLRVEAQNTSINRAVKALQNEFADDSELHNLAERLFPLVKPFAPTESEERNSLIRSLREYIGNNYKLFNRMIRNRREHSGLDLLFPGLSGCEISRYGHGVSLLDDFVGEFVDYVANLEEATLDQKNVLVREVISSYLSSPLKVSNFVKSNLIAKTYADERGIDYEALGQVESDLKAQACATYSLEWMSCNPDGLVVIFADDQKDRDKIETLLAEIGAQSDQAFNILALDDETKKFRVPETGVLLGGNVLEDGLNLHGPKRLVVHYSLPLSLSRIEQRMGRVNRYSANLKTVRRIASMVAVPDSKGITSQWTSILVDDVGIFSNSIASIQNVLEDSFDDMWTEVSLRGSSSLTEWSETKLLGHDGLIKTEREAVRRQEEMLTIEEDIFRAKIFADKLAEFEGEHGLQFASKLDKWIKKILVFGRDAPLDEEFHYGVLHADTVGQPQTLVNVRDLRDRCYLGFDFDAIPNRRTHAMSADRTLVAEGKGVIPLRYGVPFVDSIWDLLSDDPKGLSTGILLVKKTGKGSNLTIFFRLQILSDKNFLRHVVDPDAVEGVGLITRWFDQSGSMVADDMENFLNPDDSLFHKEHLTPETWEQVGDWVSPNDWKVICSNVFQSVLGNLRSTIETEPVVLSVTTLLVVD